VLLNKTVGLRAGAAGFLPAAALG